MQRAVASRSISGGSFGQLDEDLLGDETLVAYAAAAGTRAADGSGRNSPYTSALLAHLDEPLEILTLFRRVRARVLEVTNGEQRPHEYQSLLREHYLSGAPAVEAVTVEAAAPDVADVDVGELDVAQLRVLAERGDAEAHRAIRQRPPRIHREHVMALVDSRHPPQDVERRRREMVQPPSRLRMRQGHTPALKVDMLPTNREHFRDPQPRQRGYPDRRNARREPLVESIERGRQRRQFRRVEHPVSGFLAGPFDASHGVRVLRSPLPGLEQIEQARDEREHAVPGRVRQRPNGQLHVRMPRFLT